MSTTTAPNPNRLRRTSRWFDQRLGIAKFASNQFNKVFPDHWSFMLGEVTLYCFVVLLATGVFLTFFFDPSQTLVTYHGTYEPLRGVEMSKAYESALRLSFDVKAGLVMRQMHHWAALLFMAAMVMHMWRVFFTGAYRRPRELSWVIGVALLILGMANGFLGYSLLDDLLSGTGVRVAYSIALGIPVVGPWLANLVFGGGPFPGPDVIPRFYVLHILLLPALIAGLLGAHLGIVWFQKHTQFRGPDRTEQNVVGTKLFPTYAAKAIGLMFLVFAVLAAMGGLAQINAVWVFGPFAAPQTAGAVSSASQPDWYMAWLDGMLRLIPGWETRVGGFLIPNYFWGGVVLGGITFTALFAWPWLEPRWTKDHDEHNLLDRPRDTPFRTSFGAAMLAFFLVIFIAASNDVLATVSGISPEHITMILRVLLFVAPVVTYFVTRRVVSNLHGTAAHPALPGPNHTVVRTPDGGYAFAHGHHHNATDHDEQFDNRLKNDHQVEEKVDYS